MSLAAWRDQGWLRDHRTTPQEIADLLAAADRDLATCALQGLHADWRLSIAHNAALVAATAALAACGYRASREGQHYRVLQSLALTVGADKDLVRQLDAVRRKRNLGAYERAGAVSQLEANGAVELAHGVRQRVDEWLRANYPDLLH